MVSTIRPNQFLIYVEQTAADHVDGEMRVNMFAHLHAQRKRGGLEQLHQRRCQRVDIAGGDQLTRKPAGENIANPPGVRCGAGQSAGHGFQQGVRHSFLQGGEGEGICGLIIMFGLVARRRKQNGFTDAQFVGEAFPWRGLFAVTKKHEAGADRERSFGLGERPDAGRRRL